MKNTLSYIKRILSYPKWNNPVYNYKQTQVYWKRIMDLEGAKEIYREQNRHAIAMMLEGLAAIIIMFVILLILNRGL